MSGVASPWTTDDGLLRLSHRAEAAVPLDRSDSVRVISVVPPKRRQMAESLVAARRRRSELMPGVEFGEPCWDILLDLYLAHSRQRRISISSVCIAAGVPTTTALRHIHTMLRRGQLLREADQTDGRRAFITLAPEMILAVEQVLDFLIGCHVG